jgi:hypothetical protein
VTAATGPRPFESSFDLNLRAGLEKRGRIVLPACLVEIDRKKPAHLILQQWVHASHERLPCVIVS